MLLIICQEHARAVEVTRLHTLYFDRFTNRCIAQVRRTHLGISQQSTIVLLQFDSAPDVRWERSQPESELLHVPEST